MPRLRLRAHAGWALSTAALLVVGAGLTGAARGLLADGEPPGVEPAAVTLSLAPSESATVTKTVTTPVVPPSPDIVLLADTTGSMEPAIERVRRGFPAIASAVRRAQPDSRFAVASYRDLRYDGEEGFRVVQDLTDDLAEVEREVRGLTTGGGGLVDEEEDQISALWRIANGEISFREGSSRIVVWFGDASGRDPSGPDPNDPTTLRTLQDAIDALVDRGIRVIAVDLDSGYGDGLDGPGHVRDGPPRMQATRITEATNGILYQDVPPEEIAGAITEGLTNLPVTVGHQLVECDPLLRVVLEPASRTVTSGDQAQFAEAITVAPDAPQGSTLTCSVRFTLSEDDEPDVEPQEESEFTQTITVTVNDVTAPVVTVDDRNAVAPDTQGVAIEYTATAVDAVDGELDPVCTPASGSTFPIGTTTVTCGATDEAGNTGTDTATFVVLPPTAPVRDQADVSVAVALTPALAHTGGPITASFTLSNAGPQPATGVVLAATLPTPTDPAARSLGAQSACTLAAPCTLPPGGRTVVTLPASYATAITGEVRATVSSRPSDPDPADNSAAARLTVVQPVLTLTPAVGPPGTVVQARGTGFPARSTVELTWEPGITAERSPVVVGADGTFHAQVLVIPKDQLGPRVLRASGPGYTPVEAPFQVVPRSLQPPLFVGRG